MQITFSKLCGILYMQNIYRIYWDEIVTVEVEKQLKLFLSHNYCILSHLYLLLRQSCVVTLLPKCSVTWKPPGGASNSLLHVSTVKNQAWTQKLQNGVLWFISIAFFHLLFWEHYKLANIKGNSAPTTQKYTFCTNINKKNIWSHTYTLLTCCKVT